MCYKKFKTKKSKSELLVRFDRGVPSEGILELKGLSFKRCKNVARYFSTSFSMLHTSLLQAASRRALSRSRDLACYRAQTAALIDRIGCLPESPVTRIFPSFAPVSSEIPTPAIARNRARIIAISRRPCSKSIARPIRDVGASSPIVYPMCIAVGCR